MVADLIRAVAFVGIVLVDGFVPTVALALLAGAGTALFTPATLAALPSLVARERLPAATSLYGAISDFGLAAGPALAALVLVGGGTDARPARERRRPSRCRRVVLSRLRLRARARWRPRSTRERLVAARGRHGGAARRRAGIPGLWTILFASAVALFFGGLVNVAELPFVEGGPRRERRVVLGGRGARRRGHRRGLDRRRRRRIARRPCARRYLMGLFMIGFGFFVSGLAPGIELLLVTFAVTGFGNGLMLVYERLIVQELVPDRLTARIFGVKDALTAWAFALSFLAAGGLVSVFGARAVVISAGAAVLVVSMVVGVKLRGSDVYTTPPAVPPDDDGRAPVITVDRPQVEV